MPGSWLSLHAAVAAGAAVDASARVICVVLVEAARQAQT